MKMPFGKYEGSNVTEINRYYLHGSASSPGSAVVWPTQLMLCWRVELCQHLLQQPRITT